MRLNFALGTAAELIKLYPLIRLAEARGHIWKIVATGQSRANLLMQAHDFGLSEDRFHWLIENTVDLESSGQALKWFLRLRSVAPAKVGAAFDPEATVVVHGDTLSTYLSAFHARKRRLRVAHVEAGLRSQSLWNPFPEEILRRRVARLADVHFAPDDASAENLRRENVRGRIVCTKANTLMDAIHWAANQGMSSNEPPFVLANLHRYENLNSEKNWSVLIAALTETLKRWPVELVAHPQTRYKLEQTPQTLSRLMALGLKIVDRMPFSRFMTRLKACEFLLSDGGSNQEECSYLGKPCLLLRRHTERGEGLHGSCVLSHLDPEIIRRFLADPLAYRREPMVHAFSPSEKILEELENVSKFADT